MTYFLLSLILTFLILYICNPDPQVILKYPKYTEKMSDLYVDENNVCYRYETKEIK